MNSRWIGLTVAGVLLGTGAACERRLEGQPAVPFEERRAPGERHPDAVTPPPGQPAGEAPPAEEPAQQPAQPQARGQLQQPAQPGQPMQPAAPQPGQPAQPQQGQPQQFGQGQQPGQPPQPGQPQQQPGQPPAQAQQQAAQEQPGAEQEPTWAERAEEVWPQEQQRTPEAELDEPAREEAAAAARAARGEPETDEPVVIASATFEGQVVEVRQEEIHVRDDEGNIYELQVDARTQATVGERPIEVQQLREGSPVRASFDMLSDRGQFVARELEVLGGEQGRGNR
jgi:hypothetical protein